METRSNHILVGIVTIALLGILAAFLVWLVGYGDGPKKEYDIFFKQSVGGLANGAGVSFAGVPSGQVKDIELWKKDPDFVRVRIEVNADTPILQGTTATISSISFTSPPQIQLDGAVKEAKPIDALGPEGVPIIPTKPGALGELLNNAPLVLERVATLVDRLSLLLSDENQESIRGILRNSDKLTGNLADQTPELRRLLKEAGTAAANAAVAAEKVSALSENTNELLQNEGKTAATELQKTLQSANKSIASLDKVLNEAKPGIQTFTAQTLPEVDALVQNMQALTKSVTSVSEKLDEGGASSLLSAPPLPDYEP